MIVGLTYFKKSGKFYSEAEYLSSKSDFYGSLDEIRRLQEMGTLPGLVGGANEFHILVEIDGLPHLILG